MSDNKVILKSNRGFVDELYKMVMDYQMEDKENCCFFEYSAHVNLLTISVRVSKKSYRTELLNLDINFDYQINKEIQKEHITDTLNAMEKAKGIRETKKNNLKEIEKKKKELAELEKCL